MNTNKVQKFITCKYEISINIFYVKCTQITVNDVKNTDINISFKPDNKNKLIILYWGQIIISTYILLYKKTLIWLFLTWSRENYYHKIKLQSSLLYPLLITTN